MASVETASVPGALRVWHQEVLHGHRELRDSDDLACAAALEAAELEFAESGAVRGADSLNGAAAAVEPKFRLYDDAELEQLQAPDWLIEGLIPAQGFAVLHSPPGVGKTFLAIDWAFSIAAMPAWRGRRLGRGPVIYVAAEGESGLKHRIAAWKHVNDLEGQSVGVYFLTDALRVPDPIAVAAFCSAVEDQVEGQVGFPPKLIVLDTLARTMGGGDENSTQDMGRFIAGVDSLRHRTGAAVLVLHHPGRNEQRERGNSSLRGAVDTMMSLTADDGKLVLEVSKQKDAPPAEKIYLRLHAVEQSCVVVGADAAIVTRSLTANQRKLLEAIRDSDPGGGLSATALERSASLKQATFYRCIKQCLEKRYIEKGRRGVYRLTPDGVDALLSLSPSYQ